MSIILDYPVIFWIILLGHPIIRTLLPLRTKYDFTKIPIQNTERSEWKGLRDHNMVLASFTIVAIAIIFALPSDTIQDKKPALFYFSIAIFNFIIGSYLFRFTMDRRIPYTAETLEYVGIIALGIGLLYLVSSLVNDILFDVIYLIFFLGIVIITIIDLTLNYSWFYPKTEPNG